MAFVVIPTRQFVCRQLFSMNRPHRVRRCSAKRVGAPPRWQQQRTSGSGAQSLSVGSHLIVVVSLCDIYSPTDVEPFGPCRGRSPSRGMFLNSVIRHHRSERAPPRQSLAPRTSSSPAPANCRRVASGRKARVSAPPMRVRSLSSRNSRYMVSYRGWNFCLKRCSDPKPYTGSRASASRSLSAAIIPASGG